MRFGFEAKTHYPGARFSVHLCLDARRGSVSFVASNAKLNPVTGSVYCLHTFERLAMTKSINLLEIQG